MTGSVLTHDLKDRLVYKPPQPGKVQAGVSNTLRACFRFICLPIDFVNQKTFETAQLIANRFGKKASFPPSLVAKIASMGSFSSFLFNGRQTNLGYTFKIISLFAYRAHSLRAVENESAEEQGIMRASFVNIFGELLMSASKKYLNEGFSDVAPMFAPLILWDLVSTLSTLSKLKSPPKPLIAIESPQPTKENI